MLQHNVSDATALVPAAQYVRMSTERQQYSIANQSATIALYAAAHQMGIVRSYVDAGKSGLTIRGRDGLKDLIHTVEQGNATFRVILVYDVSRWGRFQDADESAHYEFLCKQAGIEVRYCAELFENNNKPISNLIKALKRAMAAEYSRELSSKVIAGQRRLAAMGFHMGGVPYGYARLLVDKDCQRKQVLNPGQWKSLQTDRTLLVPGQEEDVALVRRIFNLFTVGKQTRASIVRTLNDDGIMFRGNRWQYATINYILRNPVYVGTNLYSQTHADPGGPRKPNAKTNWVTCTAAFPPIVDAKQFLAAQALLANKQRRLTKQEMIDDLRKLWKEKRTLTAAIIDAANHVQSSATYRKHFGSLNHVYRSIGFYPNRKYHYVTDMQQFRTLRAALFRDIASQIHGVGGSIAHGGKSLILINGETTAAIYISRPSIRSDGNAVWPLKLKKTRPIDIVIVARLKKEDGSILDYYVIPSIAGLRGVFALSARNNPAFIDLYRTDTLREFVKSLGRPPIQHIV